MRRYTTPTETLVVEGIDLTGYDVRVTFRQGGRQLTVTDPTIEVLTGQGEQHDRTDTKLTFTLTQAQTGAFQHGVCEVQVNWISSDGARDATEIKQVPVPANLLAEVIEYGV